MAAHRSRLPVLLAFAESHDRLFPGSLGTEVHWTQKYMADIVSPMRVRGKQIDGISVW